VVAVALASPAAAVALAVGLVLAGTVVPLAAFRLARTVGGRQAATRGALTSELVELLRGAPELAAFGREDDAVARVRELDGRLTRLARRDALVAGLADALSILVGGLTTVAVLAIAVSDHHAGTLDRVLIAALALLALSSFDSVAPLPAALASSPGRWHRARGFSSSPSKSLPSAIGPSLPWLREVACA
jgi:ABC-type transport system involved in cytochrome bd biosynthesis fused ATPase/permease subunit